jgi:hypothetical protein
MDRQLKLSDRVLVLESERCGIVDAVDTSFGVAVFRVRYDYRPEPCQWFAAHELRWAARDWSSANVGSWLASRITRAAQLARLRSRPRDESWDEHLGAGGL